MLFGLYSGVPHAFLSVYALRLGASNQAIGLLAALPSLVNTLWLIPSARLIEQDKRVHGPLLASAFLQGLQYALIALVALVPGSFQIPSLLLIVAIGAMPTGVYAVVINNVLAEVVKPTLRVSVFANRSLLLSLSDASVIFLGGMFLGLFPLPTNYQLLFLLIFVLTIANVANLRALLVRGSAPGMDGRATSLSLSRFRQLAGRAGEARPFLLIPLLSIKGALFAGAFVRLLGFVAVFLLIKRPVA